MTEPVGYYDTSYPPEILRGYTPPVISGGARAATVERTLTVTVGTPGTYEPDVAAKDRPRNVTELRERARVTDPAPWPRGAYVLVGTSGKRAHWSGDDWRSDPSPGYAPAPATELPADEVAGSDEGDVDDEEGDPL